LVSCAEPTACGCGLFGLGIRRIDEETSAPWEPRRDRCSEGQRAGAKRDLAANITSSPRCQGVLTTSQATRPIPAGHEGLIPPWVCDPRADAIEFYKRAFGAEEVHRAPTPDGRRIMHAAIRIGGSVVFLVDDFRVLRRPGAVAQGVDRHSGHDPSLCRRLRRPIKRAAEAGATVLMRAEDMFWGRPLRRRDRPLRPHVVVRHACQGSDARESRRGHERGVRSEFLGRYGVSIAATAARRRGPHRPRLRGG
jgi:uncharacterized glyoxalase superfamily protein PhnB